MDLGDRSPHIGAERDDLSRLTSTPAPALLPSWGQPDPLVLRQELLVRYELQLEIARSRNRVLELFLDPNRLGEWQPDFIRYEFLEGDTSRSVGAKSRQWHHMGSREVEVLETITVHDYPERFAATYEAEGVWTLVENRFIASTLETTQWIVLSDVRCSGVASWVAFFAPWLFKRQTRTFMERFRTYVESSPPSR